MDHSYLIHYASEYYDPVKAHEYYMKHRELVGGKSTSGLNEEGRKVARMVKINIDEKKSGENAVSDQTRKDKLESYKVEKERSTKEQSDIKTRATEARSNAKNKDLEAAKKDREAKIKSHTDKMNSEIAKLKQQLEGMTTSLKIKKSKEIEAQIDKLRAENDKKKQQVTAAYESQKSGIDSDYDRDKKSIDEEYASAKKDIDTSYTSNSKEATETNKQEKEAIKSKYDNVYMDELEKIKKIPAYQKVAKGTKSGYQYK